MRVKISSDISESTQQIHSQKITHTPREGLFFIVVNMGPYGGKSSKSSPVKV